MSEEGSHGHPTVSAYFGVFGALIALTALTAWAAFQHLNVWNTPVALTIAVLKALLVALIFMHLRYSPKLTAIVVAAGVFWLAILILITVSDYLTRSWLPIYPR
ncbi:MAG: cytochrome C oxidase subunit IV family protein [Thermoanaerobaculia bacterium]